MLERGGAVLIFPEGRSHSDPRLSEMRTGAARVLLLSKKSPVVVPLGLWFTKKEEFRSDVLVKVGAPVPPPDDPTVEAWTEAIERALLDVTLNADDWEGPRSRRGGGCALRGEDQREDFLEGEEEAGQLGAFVPRSPAPARGARGALERTHPGEVASLARRVRAFDHLLRRIVSLPAALDDPPRPSRSCGTRSRLFSSFSSGFPVAVLGVAAWWVPYRLCGVDREPRAGRLGAARPDRALQARVAGVVLFPLTLAVWTAAAWVLGGAALGRPRLSSFFHSQESLLSGLPRVRRLARAAGAGAPRARLHARAGSRACAPSATRSSPSATGWRTCLAARRIIPPDDVDVPAIPPPVPYERASFVLAALALLAALLLSTSSRRSSRASSRGCSCTVDGAPPARRARLARPRARARGGPPRPRRGGPRRARDRPPLGLRARADRRPAGRPREDGGDARAPAGDARGARASPAASRPRRIDRGGRGLAARARGRAAARGHRRRARPRARAPRGRRRRPRLLPRARRSVEARSRRSSRRRLRRFGEASGPSRRRRSRSRP